MTEQAQRSEIRDWVQAIVVVAGVLAGIWEFVFKEILLPATAPINLTTEVSVKEAGFKGPSSDKSQGQLEAIEIFVTAKNPSTRNVYLLNNCWYAQGLTIGPDQKSKSWINDVNNNITALRNDEGAYYAVKKSALVGAGGLFPEDQWLRPNEAISTSMIFYVPQGAFDALYVHVQMPTTAVMNSVEVVWAVTSENACRLRLFRKRNGSLAEEINNYAAAVADPNIVFQIETSTRELSLWHSNSQ